MRITHPKAEGAFSRHELADVIEYDLKFGRVLPQYSCIEDGQLPSGGTAIPGFSVNGYPRWAAVWPIGEDTSDFDCSLHSTLAAAEVAHQDGIAAARAVGKAA